MRQITDSMMTMTRVFDMRQVFDCWTQRLQSAFSEAFVEDFESFTRPEISLKLQGHTTSARAWRMSRRTYSESLESPKTS